MMSNHAYATTEQADRYLFSTQDADIWSKTDTRHKIMALMGATIAINSLESYQNGLIGRRKSPDQPFAFPRTGQDTVPDAVVMACCHEAAAMIADQLDDASARRKNAIRQGVTSVSIGDVSESYADPDKLGASRSTLIRSDAAWALLLPFLRQRGVHPIK